MTAVGKRLAFRAARLSLQCLSWIKGGTFDCQLSARLVASLRERPILVHGSERPFVPTAVIVALFSEPRNAVVLKPRAFSEKIESGIPMRGRI